MNANGRFSQNDMLFVHSKKKKKNRFVCWSRVCFNGKIMCHGFVPKPRERRSAPTFSNDRSTRTEATDTDYVHVYKLLHALCSPASWWGAKENIADIRVRARC